MKKIALLTFNEIESINTFIKNTLEKQSNNSFIITTDEYRLLWVEDNVYIGYKQENEKEQYLDMGKQGLFVIPHKQESTQITMFLLTENKEEIQEKIFNFLIEECGYNVMECRRSLYTSQSLSVAYVDENGQPDYSMNGTIEQGNPHNIQQEKDVINAD